MKTNILKGRTIRNIVIDIHFILNDNPFPKQPIKIE